MFVVYVLYSPGFSKIYIGYTSNLDERIKSHNELSQKSWTKKFRPWKVVYTENFQLKKDAQKREKELKGAKGREWVWSLIKNKIADGFISA